MFEDMVSARLGFSGAEVLSAWREQGVPEGLLSAAEDWRREAEAADAAAEGALPAGRGVPRASYVYEGREVVEAAMAALLSGEHLLLVGPKATGKNVLAENLAAVFGRPDWNVSTLAQAAGVAALSVPSYLEEARQLLATERKYLTGQLRQLDCVVYGGAADYLFFYASRDPGWADLLRQRGILIRDCSNYHGLAPGYYRIAVKQRRDNRRLIKEMKEITKHVCTFTSRID